MNHTKQMEQTASKQGSYLRFFAMIATSMIAMYFLMYKNTKVNVIIFVGTALLLLLSIWLVRSQATITDVDYMEGMIPHHSIAILTSERAGIEDPRVRMLADEIIEAQRREIKEMEWLIEDIKENGPSQTQTEADVRSVPNFSRTTE